MSLDKNTKYFMLAAAAVAVTAVLCIVSVDQTNLPDADADHRDGSLAAVPLSGDINGEEISGNCGNSLTFMFADNILTVSGSGAMWDYDLNADSAPWHDCSEHIAEIVLPDGLTSIGDWAFYCCSSLTSVDIPDSVRSIGYASFAYCDSLTSVDIPDSVASIGDAAFAYCDSLTSVDIPDSVTSISDHMFTGCSSLTSAAIPGSVRSIGYAAFADCSSLTSVTIPDSVASIGSYAFAGCPVKEVYDHSGLNVRPGDYGLPKDATVFSKGCGEDLLWGYNESSGTLVISGSGVMCDYDRYSAPWYGLSGNIVQIVLSDGLTHIGGFAFADCSSLTSVVIPDSVESIGRCAFYVCRALTSVVIPDSVESIGRCAFYDCSSLTSVNIPDSLTSIADSVFYSCRALTSITIPDSVTSIGSHAFSHCSSLTSLTIPGSVKKVGSYAFSECTSLTTVTIFGYNTDLGYGVFYCSSVKEVYNHTNFYIYPGQYGLSNKVKIIECDDRET